MGYDGRASRAKIIFKTIRQVRRYDVRKKYDTRPLKVISS